MPYLKEDSSGTDAEVCAWSEVRRAVRAHGRLRVPLQHPARSARSDVCAQRSMPACGLNDPPPRLRRAIGFSVGTNAERRRDICSKETDSPSEIVKNSAGLIGQRESCKMLTRRALVPACGQDLRSERRVRTSSPRALADRFVWPLHTNVESERSSLARVSPLGATCGPTLTPAREPALDSASRRTLATESALLTR